MGNQVIEPTMTPFVAVASMTTNVSRITAARGWFLDSGTTNHVCGSRTNFMNYRAVERGQVVMANGEQADVIGMGTVKLTFSTRNVLILRDVLHVPTIRKGLVSASKLAEHGFVTCLGIEARIMKNLTLVAEGYLQDGLYRLELAEEPREIIEISDDDSSVSSVGSNSI